MRLLLSAADDDHQSTLCILGSGNGNDVDLVALLSRFARLTLVDLDSDAVDHSLTSLAGVDEPAIETHVGVDLSGILDLLASPPEQSLADETIDQIVDRLQQPSPSSMPIPSSMLDRYDVVVSTCLLSQMIDSVFERLGPDHPRLVEVTLALRDHHLRLLRELTHPGGTAFLITDFVSTDTLPELAEAEQHELDRLLARAIEEHNFFTGLNPAVLWHRMADPLAVGGAATAELLPPWRWQLGNRIYAVAALRMTRQD